MSSTAATDRLITPYGGELIDRLADPAEIADRVRAAVTTVRISASTRIHVVNIATGCYSPLTGFMSEEEYRAVVSAGRLPAGHDWKVPILLHADGVDLSALRVGSGIALCDEDGTAFATVDVDSVFHIDPIAYCRAVMGTEDIAHPGVRTIRQRGIICIGGLVTMAGGLRRPQRHEHSPAESRALLSATGMRSFTAFSTRNICHRGHEFQHRIALDRTDLLGIHVISGAALSGSFEPDIVLDVYDILSQKIYPPGRTLINNLRLPPIYAGPKEAFLQATVLQNLGYTHFIVGRDHAGVGSHYGRYASQEIFAAPSALDIEVLALAEPHYCRHCDEIVTESFCDRPNDLERLNGRDVRRLLVERRYEELNMILRPEVRDFLIARHETTAIFVS